MYKLRRFLFVAIYAASSLAYAQQPAALYDEAAAAYQQQDYKTAEQIWVSLAAEGDANSQYAMAIMHLKKEAQNAQDNAAFAYLVDAAKQQHVAAMFNLGVAYWEGRGVAQQTAKALNWWEVAARRGDAGAQYNLGLAYHMGEGRAKDDKEAIRWVQKAIENGHPQAESLLASLQQEEEVSASQIQTTQGASTQPLVTPELQQANSTVTEKPVETVPVQPKINENTQIAETAPPTVTQTAATDTNNKPAITVNNNSAKPATTSKESAILRATPNTNATSLATIPVGTKLDALETKGEWSKVVIKESYPLWVYEAYVDDEGNGIGTIKGQNVNIRPSPSTDNITSPALGQLNTGDKIAIVERRSPWVKIIPPQALPAWVMTKDIN